MDRIRRRLASWRKPASRHRDNVLLTGTGRSGTTLSCSLLNKLPDTVALFEPMKVQRFEAMKDHADVSRAVEQFCERQRKLVREEGRVMTKNLGGIVPDNPFGTAKTAEGLRSKSVSRGKIMLDKELSDDFTLVVKHISAFTAVLGELVKRLPVYAIVRNPLPVLASWNSIDFNLQQGHVPAAERIAPDLRASLAAIDDPLDRQIHILGWFHGQFRRHLPDESIIRYESIVESGGSALGVAVPRAAELDEPLQSRNVSEMYERESLERIGERLLRSDGAQWESYTKESVESLLELSLSSGG